MSATQITAQDTRSDIQPLLGQAIKLHQAGHLNRADEICQEILDVHPQHPDALHLLGVSAQVRGDYRRAIELIRQAIDLNPSLPFYHNNLGNTLMASDRLEEAIDAFQEALRLSPRLSAVWLNLSNAYLKRKLIPKAKDCVNRCLQISPQNPPALYTLGKIHLILGEFEIAERNILRCLKMQPAFIDALKELANLWEKKDRLPDIIYYFKQGLESVPRNGDLWSLFGNVYRKLKEDVPAERCFQKALDIDKQSTSAYNGLGVLYTKQGRFEISLNNFKKGLSIDPESTRLHGNLGNLYRRFGQALEARHHFNRAINLDPQNIAAKLNLSNLEYEQGRSELAVRLLHQIIEGQPQNSIAYGNLGVILQSQGNLKKAKKIFQTAVRLDPLNPDLICNLGNVYKAQGRISSALTCYRRAIQIKPDHYGANCNFLYGQLYLPTIPSRHLLDAARRWGRRQTKLVTPFSRFSNDTTPSRRLRIGYVSPDFRKHSVSFFFLPLIEAHNRDRFEIYCYSEARRSDKITEKIQKSCHQWRSTVGHTDHDVAKQILGDRIDILVDLAGHTANNRLGVFSRKPAPIQLTWLGYPDTTGLSTMDCRLTDDIADPWPNADPFFIETLIRLPNGFLCYQPPDDAPPVAVNGTNFNNSVVFGSFNNLPKINDGVVALWAQILKEIPQAKLLLKSKPLADGSTRDRYINLFRSWGISPERIILKHWAESTTEHLELYNHLTVALDPFPYNGTTTTCEALFMGTPVITLLGRRHSARVGASILHRVQLMDLVAANETEYVELAVKLARNNERLCHFRDALRTTFLDSDLCDGRQFTRKVEETYRHLWHRWCQSALKS